MNMSNMEWYIVAGVVIGSVFVVILGLFALVKAFYIKVPQGTALIINDTTSQPKVKFTGGLVLPVIHKKEFMQISLLTLEIDRRGKEGLICRDNMRADITVAGKRAARPGHGGRPLCRIADARAKRAGFAGTHQAKAGRARCAHGKRGRAGARQQRRRAGCQAACRRHHAPGGQCAIGAGTPEGAARSRWRKKRLMRGRGPGRPRRARRPGCRV